MCDKQGRDTQQPETSLPLFLLVANLEEGGVGLDASVTGCHALKPR